jgi:hypothetical protein
MTQQLKSEWVREWSPSTLPSILAGDVCAAGISATLVAPVITAIDRAVVENAASPHRPLLPTLRTHLACSIRHPRAFFNAKPFFFVWMLYAGTFSTANTVESVGTALTKGADQVLVGGITFLATCLVNVPLGVWKDVRFVQLFGQRAALSSNASTPAAKQPVTGAAQPAMRAAKVPKVVGATFLLRDAITIFGSITLPTFIPTPILESISSNPKIRETAVQLAVPMLSQVVATPVHLLGLDLYGQQQRIGAVERWRAIRQNLGGTTMVRCARIVPAFGVGCIVNANLREWFHTKAGVKKEL